MAITVASGGSQQNIISLTAIGEDWDAGYARPLHSIHFQTGTDNSDVIVVKADTDSGPVLLTHTAASATDEIIKYFGGVKVRPVLDFSDCTLSAGHTAIFVFLEDY